MVAKTIELPNIKKCFIPDPGYMIADSDLKQADAQIVAWEANDEELKYIFRNKLDLHLANAERLFNLGIELDDLHDEEKVTKYKKDFSHERDMAKRGVHLTNYLGTVPTCATALGVTRKVAEDFQKRWFVEHPGIRDWHDRVEDSLMTDRTVRNAFGYRHVYFDRIETCLRNAVAWIPQSTVALIISKAMIALGTERCIQLLMQIHDSTISQFPVAMEVVALRKIKRAMEQTVPYEDPLVIPADVKVSTKSWGDCQDRAWP